MPLDKLKQLLDLVGLGLTANLLQVEEFRDAGMHVDVVTAADSGEPKAECLREGARLGEAKVVGCAKSTLQEPARVHALDCAISAPLRPGHHRGAAAAHNDIEFSCERSESASTRG
jgi:hypothetical protein